MEEYIAKYFLKTRRISLEHLPNSNVVLQFFQRKTFAVLCGMAEVLRLLKKNTDTKKYTIRFLKDGSVVGPNEPVLQLEGSYHLFGHYEGVIDGILSRCTSVATNAQKLVSAAKPVQIIAMADRADHYYLQHLDGLALATGGVKMVVTQAMAKSKFLKSVGTMPHALIQMFYGDVIKATEAYYKTFGSHNLTALVDFNNDVITDAIRVAKHFGKKLKMVRVDTPANLSDAYFKKNEEYGVTPNLVKALRNALNQGGFKHVKIIVSSGFNEKKIRFFQKEKTPVDFFGVGQALLKIANTFTCDAVKINGVKLAKAGRTWKRTKRLTLFK